MRYPRQRSVHPYSITTLPGGKGEGEVKCSPNPRSGSCGRRCWSKLTGDAGHVEGAQENSNSQSLRQLCGAHAHPPSERSWFHAGWRGSYKTDALRWALLCLTRPATRTVLRGMTMA
jgi:hypothetical protein